MHPENQNPKATRILEELVQLLDIPPGYYQKAVDRYESMATYFHRPQSTIRHLDPLVHPHGSFRLGTVIRPLFPDEGYDLDLVCRVAADKRSISQEDLKKLIGGEVTSYSRENGFKEGPIEKRRCWTQHYQDEVKFHMDVLPSIPAGDRYRRQLQEAGISQDLIAEAINITDNTEPNYSYISPDWPRSNPRGFAIWFDWRMDDGGLASQSRRRLFEKNAGVYASVDEVPASELKTPLQRVIQLLKRHRDQMFRTDCKGKPISIIITTLAARAYNGEADLSAAMAGVLAKMGEFVSQSRPRIPNPVDPNEDFTDRWDAKLEDNFWRWLRQAQRDFAQMAKSDLTKGSLERQLEESFAVRMSPETMAAFAFPALGAPAIIVGQDRPVTTIRKDAASSWGFRG